MMRVRNPSTGTVVTVGEETGRRYLAAGWEPADAKSTSLTSEAADDDAKPTTRRRRASR